MVRQSQLVLTQHKTRLIRQRSETVYTRIVHTAPFLSAMTLPEPSCNGATKKKLLIRHL